MTQYRGKSITAWQVGFGPMPDWVPDLEKEDPVERDPDSTEDSNYIEVRATKGIKTVYVDDWVIKDADGTIRTMSDGKFRLRYDPEKQVVQAQLGDDTFQPTDAQLQEIGDMVRQDRSPVHTFSEGDKSAAQSAPTPQPNANAATQPSGPADMKGVFGTPEAIRQRIDQRAQNARPAVHKHKPGEYK